MTTSLKRCQYCDGFMLIGPATHTVCLDVAASISIAKGDILTDNGSGYLTNGSITAFVETSKYYVALEPCDNSSGSAGDLKVICVPCDIAENQFWVPNESATVAAQTDIGEIVDLESEDGIDVTDTTVKALGFLIDGIDISTKAVAANTGGYVRGRFVVEGDQA